MDGLLIVIMLGRLFWCWLVASLKEHCLNKEGFGQGDRHIQRD